MKKDSVRFLKDDRDQNYLFHQHYGAAKAFPEDFLLGNGNNPNQDSDSAPTECTGYAQSDNESDILHYPCSPDFSYAAGLEAEGAVPNTGGCDFRASLQGVINRGVLPASASLFSAKTKGELFVSDITNWNPVASQALSNAESSYRWVTTGPYDVFDNIRSALWVAQKGVSAATPFFSEWVGSVIAPVPNWNGEFTLHNWAIKGSATKYVDGPLKGGLIRNGESFLVTKTWQGFYQYFDRPTINKLLSLPNAGAAIVSQDGNRLWNILCGLTVRFPNLVFLLPKLWSIVNV